MTWGNIIGNVWAASISGDIQYFFDPKLILFFSRKWQDLVTMPTKNLRAFEDALTSIWNKLEIRLMYTTNLKETHYGGQVFFNGSSARLKVKIFTTQVHLQTVYLCKWLP